MGDDERERLTPHLELPKLFGRRPKPARADDETSAVVTDEDAEPDPAEVVEAPAAKRWRRPRPAPADDEPTVVDAVPVREPKPEPVEPSTQVMPAAEAGTPLFVDEAAQTTPPAAKKARRPLPHFAGPVAAGVTGLVVGLATVGLTALALRGCEVVRNTSSCGSPAGLLLLIAILVAMIYAGGLLLRLARVPDPGSTSFLAVGLVAVVALLFLLDYILNWWMVLVIPSISVLTFLGAHWVTTAFVEPSEIADREDTPVDPSLT